MPKTDDQKPRNKARRHKAILNGKPAVVRISERTIRRSLQRARLVMEIAAEREIRAHLDKAGLRWRDYELAFIEAYHRTRKAGGNIAGVLASILNEKAAAKQMRAAA